MSHKNMPRDQKSSKAHLVVFGLLMYLVCFPLMGCVGASAQLMYLIYGNEKPAKCDKLKGKRVAIMVTANTTSFDTKSVGESMERLVALNFAAKGEKISVVPTSEIERWKDNHPSDSENFRSLGEAVEADYVLHLQIENYDIMFGKTLYRGQCDYQADLYDVKEKTVAFFLPREEFVFPKNGKPQTDTNDRNFQRFYLNILADRISRNFYPNDPNETVALDSVETF